MNTEKSLKRAVSDMQEKVRSASGSPASPCSVVFQVVCEHNRDGEWIAGTYDNEEAAKAHKKYSDARINGWDNFAPAEVRSMEIASKFSPPNAEV